MNSTITQKTRSSVDAASRRACTFVDLFAGCGGLSLGLLQAGWTGLFAIERSPDAFKTLSHNLIDENAHRPSGVNFLWPHWLDQKPIDITKFIAEHRSDLATLQGKVTLVAGGPPCQGFSFAGRRQADDPRNQLFKKHLELVDILRPEVVFLENVQGISIAHGRTQWLEGGQRGRPKKSYAEKIKHLLDQHGYEPQQVLVRACDFGVPQYRPRYLTLGIRRNLFVNRRVPNFLDTLMSIREDFLSERNLPVNQLVTAADAISDFHVLSNMRVECIDPESPKGFQQLLYQGPKSDYQRLMHGGLNGHPINRSAREPCCPAPTLSQTP